MCIDSRLARSFAFWLVQMEGFFAFSVEFGGSVLGDLSSDHWSDDRSMISAFTNIMACISNDCFLTIVKMYFKCSHDAVTHTVIANIETPCQDEDCQVQIDKE